jgi:hypothetical protein
VLIRGQGRRSRPRSGRGSPSRLICCRCPARPSYRLSNDTARIEYRSSAAFLQTAGSTDAARGGLRSARPNIKNVASSVTPPIATATPVIINPIPIAVISIISVPQHIQSISPDQSARTFPMICSLRQSFRPIQHKFEKSSLAINWRTVNSSVTD